MKERKFTPSPRLTLEALENFEKYWVKKPLNEIRKRQGFAEITPETLAEKMKKHG